MSLVTDTLHCNNGGAQEWAARRLYDVSTTGVSCLLEEEYNMNALSDLHVMIQLGDLLTEFKPSYHLYQVPIPSSIKVYLNFKPVPTTWDNYFETYNDGWVYDAINKSITFSNIDISCDDRVNISTCQCMIVVVQENFHLATKSYKT